MSIILKDGYPSHLFTKSKHDDGTVVLVAEASDLGYIAPRAIYDDAADVGVAVRSDATGTVVRYYLDHEDLNGDDVAGWRFLPIPEDCRRVASARKTSVLIIND